MSAAVPQSRPKTLTPAIIGALIALLALAVVVVVVVLNKDDGAQGGGTDPSASYSGPASSSEPQEPVETKDVTSAELGVTYRYPVSGYDDGKWTGPYDAMLGIVDASSIIDYEACSPSAGSDVLIALTTSSETDLATAARIAAVDLAKSVWANDPEITDPTDAVQKTVGDDLTGQLVEIGSTRPGGADECGTTQAHIATFAFENQAGDVVVMVTSYRMDGETVKAGDDIAQDIADTVSSLELV